MNLLCLDFETTGFDPAVDHIIEVGAVVWCTERQSPICFYSEFVKTDKEVPLEIQQITGIDPELLEHGVTPVVYLGELNSICRRYNVRYIAAHNGENFDKPFLYAALKGQYGFDYQELTKLKWIDTRQDLPFDKEPDSRKLKYMLADFGYLNPFSHRAVFDALMVGKLLSFFDIEKVIKYSEIPWIVIQACVSYDERQLAKEKRYYWQNVGNKTYEKKWVKLIKKNLLDEEKKQSPFRIEVLEEL